MARAKKTGGGNNRPKTVSFRLPPDLMEEMRALAKQNRRTLSGEVQLALEMHLSSNGKPASPSNVSSKELDLSSAQE